MRGDLSETSAVDACRDLAAQAATGAFEVDGPDGPGRIVFRDGHLVGAVSPTPRARLGDRLVGAGLLDDDALTAALGRQAQTAVRPRLGALLVAEGLTEADAVRRYVHEQVLDALQEIVGWHFGVFRFVPGPVDDVQEVPFAVGVDEALEEVTRRQEEWEELARVVPHLDAIPDARPHPADVDASLTPEERAVFEAVDGTTSVRQLARELGFGELATTRAVRELSLLGVVDVRLPEDEIGAALDEAFASLGARHDGPLDLDIELPVEPEPPAPDPVGPGPFEPDPEPPPFEPEPFDPDPPPFDPEPPPFDPDPPPFDPDPPPFEPEPFEPGPGADAPVADGPVAEEPLPASTSPTAGPSTGADVSEFLRELSRLAFDDPPPGDAAPRPRPRPEEPADRSGTTDDRKKKRRGLFGLGG